MNRPHEEHFSAFTILRGLRDVLPQVSLPTIASQVLVNSIVWLFSNSILRSWVETGLYASQLTGVSMVRTTVRTQQRLRDRVGNADSTPHNRLNFSKFQPTAAQHGPRAHKLPTEELRREEKNMETRLIAALRNAPNTTLPTNSILRFDWLRRSRWTLMESLARTVVPLAIHTLWVELGIGTNSEGIATLGAALFVHWAVFPILTQRIRWVVRSVNKDLLSAADSANDLTMRVNNENNPNQNESSEAYGLDSMKLFNDENDLFYGYLPGALSELEARKRAYPISTQVYAGFFLSLLSRSVHQIVELSLTLYFPSWHVGWGAGPLPHVLLSTLSKVLCSPLHRLELLYQIKMYDGGKGLFNHLKFLISSENLRACARSWPYYGLLSVVENFTLFTPSLMWDPSKKPAPAPPRVGHAVLGRKREASGSVTTSRGAAERIGREPQIGDEWNAVLSKVQEWK